MIVYPEAYAVFCDEAGVAEWDCDVMFSRKTDADCHLESLVEATAEEDEQRPDNTDMSQWHVVQLFPAPVVERMIAEAEQRGRDAERKRSDECLELEGLMSVADAVLEKERAVAAERERCIGEIRFLIDWLEERGCNQLLGKPGQRRFAFPEMHDKHTLLSEVLRRIESGIEPGKGGE